MVTSECSNSINLAEGRFRRGGSRAAIHASCADLTLRAPRNARSGPAERRPARQSGALGPGRGMRSSLLSSPGIVRLSLCHLSPN